MTSLDLKWDRRHERISSEPQTRGRDTSFVFTSFSRLQKDPPTPKQKKTHTKGKSKKKTQNKGQKEDRVKRVRFFFRVLIGDLKNSHAV